MTRIILYLVLLGQSIALNVSDQSLPGPGEDYYTLSNGCPIDNPQGLVRLGNNELDGKVLLQDINLIDVLTHVTHERIPERVVHAKGSGAYGVFETTHDITNLTSLAFLNKVGKQTPLFARFSTVAGEKGSADNVRDSRGFAFKLYTEEGNLDWLFFGAPMFPLRDPAKFPSFTHAQKRDPSSNLKNASVFWDFFNQNPEGYNFLMRLFSDQGTPWSYRYTDIHSINTYRFTQPDGNFHYVRIALKTDQGVRNLTQDQMTRLIGVDPDFATRDLYTAIDAGDFPSWTAYAQIIRPGDAVTSSVNIFDATRELPEKDYPLIPFGRITLNRNPANYFAEVEQSAFQVANLVPGWDVSSDPILQVRLFPYGDTQRYRLGINFPQLPVNRPVYSYNPTRRDGASNILNLGNLPNYFPSRYGPQIVAPRQYRASAEHMEWVANVTSYLSQVTDNDFDQPRDYWHTLAGMGATQQANLVYNVASSLSGAEAAVRQQTYKVFRKIHRDLAGAVQNQTEALVLSNAML
ncbi:hypothetical protein ASPZODRAFT_20653 [Penicilliopsis zonata CBS 506.65]|uniref:Catalase core domain-containing protein n=1 Tax=Penicilliopsis zonata CBS 506.65 TaxID=1073090 RepID=A0A1L9S529_9EURO|nr:hypothetical protein ASPZODRAFT_20653 [Penicilliopsis zonata CBS 506.65]OJJ42260.1 hypothetical protein ASPZODRAFT_20653 [Penicilliopsis zonata CBS 506.65]